jgi:hypothetical protein
MGTERSKSQALKLHQDGRRVGVQVGRLFRLLLARNVDAVVLPVTGPAARGVLWLTLRMILDAQGYGEVRHVA